MERSSVLTLRIDAETKKQLDDLAKTTHRRLNLVAAEAIRNYLDVSAWQVREIEKAIEAADRGEFASEEEVRRVTTKWSSRAR